MNETQINVERPPPAGPLLVFERALLQFLLMVDASRFKRGHLNILRTIRRRSFERGQPMTDEIDLNVFAEDNSFPASTFDPSVKASFFHKSEASRAIDDLDQEGMHVIFAPPGRRGQYGINVLWSAWLVTLKRDSVRPSQGLFDLVPDDLANQLRKDFIEFGGCPPVMPQGRKSVPVARSIPTVGAGDSNTGDAMASDDAAGVGGGGVRERSPARTTLPTIVGEAMGDSLPVGAPGARSVGKIPTAESLGAQSVGKIPTMPPEADKHWPKCVGKIPTAPENAAEAGAALVSPRTPLVPVQGVQEEPVQIIPEQQAKSFVPTRARARGVGKIPTAQVTWAEQRRLLEVIEAWVGAEDMRANCRFWVTKVIRNFGWAVDLSVASLREQDGMNPKYFKDQGHRIKVLVVDLAKRAGVKNWANVPPGPEPEH